jgi:hypothetical protein
MYLDRYELSVPRLGTVVIQSLQGPRGNFRPLPVPAAIVVEIVSAPYLNDDYASVKWACAQFTAKHASVRTPK